jgi:hypothetical protein
MNADRLDRRVLGVGFVVLGVASAVAVAADAASPATSLVAAVLGLSFGLGLARLRRPPAPRLASSVRISISLSVVVLAAAALTWVVIGTTAASALDSAGTPKRSELFAMTDGLVVAAGLLLLRSRWPRRRASR